MAARSSRGSVPPSPFLAEDEIALLPSPNMGSAELRGSDASYQGAYASLPGARQAASRPRARACALLPPPRLILPLLVAAALVASFLLLTESTRNKLSQYLVFTPEQSHRIRDALFDEPSWPLAPSGFGILDAEGEHTVTAIVVHGLGDKGDGKPWTDVLADEFPFVRWVAPTADYLNITVRDGATTRAWFDIVDFDDIWGDEDVVGYVHSQQQLNQLIDDERQKMLDAGKVPRIVLLGFSQGGVMTLLATLTAPTRDRIEAAAVMSTYLPMLDSFDEIFNPAARDTPLLWVHGRADPYLTYANAELSLARLTTEPISLSNVAFSGYDGVQHSWNGDMLDDVVDWFEAHVPRHRGAGASAGAAAGGRDGDEMQQKDAEGDVEGLERVEAGGRAGAAHQPHEDAAAAASTTKEDPFDAPGEDASSAVEGEGRVDADLDRLDALAVADDLVRARRRRRRRLDRIVVGFSAAAD
ncbi:hypothetical protein JCM9279_003070 [Rhodotorula babjevae]